MTIFSAFRHRHGHTSGSANQRPPPPSNTSVAGSLPPSYQSALLETAGVHTAQDKKYQWSTSIPSGASTESDVGSTTKTDTVVGSSDHSEPGYVYYTLFTKGGAIPSKHPMDKQEPYLGRVEARHIAPPHTVESVIRHICNVEEDSRDRLSQLFLSSSSASPMGRQEHVAILTGSGLGSNPRQPLALLLDGSDGSDGSGVYNKTIIAEVARNWGRYDSNWLSFEEGEVLHTDGVARKEKFKGPGSGGEYYSYRARNAKGKCGFVPSVHFPDPE